MDIRKIYCMATGNYDGYISKLDGNVNVPPQSLGTLFKYCVLDRIFDYSNKEIKTEDVDLLDVFLAVISSKKISLNVFLSYLQKNYIPEKNEIDDFLYKLVPNNELFENYNRSKKKFVQNSQKNKLFNNDIFSKLIKNQNLLGVFYEYTDLIFDEFNQTVAENYFKWISLFEDKMPEEIINTFKKKIKNQSNFCVREFYRMLKKQLVTELVDDYKKKNDFYIKVKIQRTNDEAKLLDITNYNGKQIQKIRLLKQKCKSIFTDIVGQREALDEIINVIYASALGISNSDGPIASMLLTGPTGVGKTETAYAISKSLFGKEPCVVDMSVLNEKHKISSLLGASAGYIGYGDKSHLLEYIEENPDGGVLLFDEFDKSHPEVNKIFMRMLDKGEIQAANGDSYDVSKFIIILTSNITEKINKTIGFNSEKQDIKNTISSNEIGNIPPELIARLDLVVPYKQLTYDERIELAKKKIDELIKKVTKNNKELNIKISYNKSVLFEIVEATNESMGIRELFRNIKSIVVKKLVGYIRENNTFTNLTVEINSLDDIVIKRNDDSKKTKLVNLQQNESENADDYDIEL